MNLIRRWVSRMNMPTAECARVAEIIQQYLDGEGTVAEAVRVERHLDECRTCGLEATALRDLKDAIRRHGDRDPDARERLQAFAERLARGDVDTADEST